MFSLPQGSFRKKGLRMSRLPMGQGWGGGHLKVHDGPPCGSSRARGRSAKQNRGKCKERQDRVKNILSELSEGIPPFLRVHLLKMKQALVSGGPFPRPLVTYVAKRSLRSKAYLRIFRCELSPEQITECERRFRDAVEGLSEFRLAG